MAKANKLLTSKHLQTLFAVSHMAIQHWRKGSDKREPLPVETVDDNPRAVGFLPAKVKAWAKKHGVELHADPVTFLANADHIDAVTKLAETKATAKTATKKDARTGKDLEPLKAARASLQRAAKNKPKPVAKKAATAAHQKPARKVVDKTPETTAIPAPSAPRRASMVGVASL